jgi:predicted GNAT family N-acyltransferase/prolipoprotein diacylglyceryltransferase
MYPFLYDFEWAGVLFRLSTYRFFVVVSLLYLFIIAWKKLVSVFPFRKSRWWFLLSEVVAFFVGSRLLYGILYLPEVMRDPLLLIRFQLSHFSLFGGLGLSLGLWYLISKKQQLPFFSTLDALAPHVGITLALMKLGCFLNGCCYGTATSMPWGITFPVESSLHGWKESLQLLGLIPQKVHPAQLFEVGAALLAGGIAWVILRKKGRVGLATASFGLTYAALRWLIFYFRAFPRASDLSNLIRGPIIYSISIMIFSLWIHRIVVSSPSSLKCKVASSKKEILQCYKLRTEVFVQEQNVPLELEMDADDEKAIHVLGRLNHNVVACGRIIMEQNHAHIGRVAVKKEQRGKGLGKHLMHYMIQVCKAKGARDVILHSQLQAIPFYESLGFKAYGDSFPDAGIEHRAMKFIL